MSKTILITGAGSGFGKAAAVELAARGHDVIAGTETREQADALATQHPELRVVHVEADAGWLPYWLQRMEQHYEFSGNAEHPDLKRHPTEYFLDQVLVAARGDERTLPSVVELVGDENVTWNTDYPHPDGTFPWGLEALEKQPISDVSKRRILWDNAALVREETDLAALLFLLSTNGTVEVHDSLVAPGDPAATCVGCVAAPGPDFLRYDPGLPAPMWNLHLLPTSAHLSSTPIADENWPCSAADPQSGRYDPVAVEDQLGGFGNRGLSDASYPGAPPTPYNSCWPPDYEEPEVLYDSWRQANVAHVPFADDDLDQLSNKEEFDIGTLPGVADTDGDGVDDLSDPNPLDPRAF